MALAGFPGMPKGRGGVMEFSSAFAFLVRYTLRVPRSGVDHAHFCFGGDEEASERRKSFQSRKPG